MKYFCYCTNIFAGMVEVLICLMSLYIDYLGAGAGTSSTQEYQPSMVMIIIMMMMVCNDYNDDRSPWVRWSSSP